MDFGHQLVGVGRYDREGPDPLTGGGVLPVLPYARDAEWRTVLHGNGIGLLRPVPLDSLPLKKAVYRQDAAPPSVGVAKGRQCAHRLALGVDRLAPAFWVGTEVGNEAPAQRVE